VAAVSVGSAAWPVAVAPACSGSAVEHAAAAAAVSAGSAAVAAAVWVGSAAGHAAVAAPVWVGSAVEHAAVAVAASALAWLPLVRAVRRQEQWFPGTETRLLIRELQMLSLVLPQLHSRRTSDE